MTDINSIILVGDVRKRISEIPKKSINCIVTSPPYLGLRNYHPGEMGQEDVEKYVEELVLLAQSFKEILTDDGTFWLNLGDSYAGSRKGRNPDGTHYTLIKKTKQTTNKGSLDGHLHMTPLPEGIKPKDLFGVPWRVAFALQKDGWYLRQEIIYNKPNPMVESVKDRPTTSHETIFFFSKSRYYYYNKEGYIESPPASDIVATIKDILVTNDLSIEKKFTLIIESIHKPNPINTRSVWTMIPNSSKINHTATFPIELPTRCILLSCPENGVVFDPFGGSGTTCVAAILSHRKSIMTEINSDYTKAAFQRIKKHSFCVPADDVKYICENSVWNNEWT